MSHKIERSAFVTYSCQQMFDLVNDIESYPAFMPGCKKAEVLLRDKDFVIARLDVSQAGIGQSFTTRNTLNAPKSMQLDLVEGPFSLFKGEWRFKELDTSACKVTFTLEFQFSNPVLDLAGSKLMSSMSGKQVDALSMRAKTLYK